MGLLNVTDAKLDGQRSSCTSGSPTSATVSSVSGHVTATPFSRDIDNLTSSDV